MPQGWRPTHPGDPAPKWGLSRAGRLVVAVTVIVGILIGLAIRAAGATDDARVAGASATTAPYSLDDGQRVEMPESGYAVTLPAGWVAMTAPEPGMDLIKIPETKMDPLIEALERDRGPAARGLLQWRFGYLGIVVDEWPPLFVLPTDEEQTLGCGIEARERPPRPLDERLAEVRASASFGWMPMSVGPEPVPVDLGIGRAWAVPGVTDAPGRFADVYHWLYLVGGDDLEVVVTCSALAQTDEAYWRPLIEGIGFLARED